jgi:hypothetical protein
MHLTEQASRWLEHRLSILDRGISDHVSSPLRLLQEDADEPPSVSLVAVPRLIGMTAHLQIIVTLLAMADTRNSAEFAFTHVRVPRQLPSSAYDFASRRAGSHRH